MVQRRQTSNYHMLFTEVSHNQTPNQYGRCFVSMKLKLTWTVEDSVQRSLWTSLQLMSGMSQPFCACQGLNMSYWALTSPDISICNTYPGPHLSPAIGLQPLPELHCRSTSLQTDICPSFPDGPRQLCLLDGPWTYGVVLSSAQPPVIPGWAP